MTKRIVVIGRGLAGVSAAIAAWRNGAKVTLIARALGRTALSSGLIGLADPTRLTSNAIPHPLAEAVDAIQHAMPRHPYNSIDGIAKTMQSAIENFLSITEAMYPSPFYSDSPPSRYPNEWGTVANSYLAPRSFAALSDETASQTAPAYLVSISGYPRFHAEFLARALSEFHLPSGLFATTDVIKVDFDRDGKIFHQPSQLSGYLENEDMLRRFGEAIAKALGNKTPGTLLVPPVLGLERYDSCEVLSEIIGYPVREMVATQSSAPGLRMSNLLKRGLDSAEIRYLQADVNGYKLDGNKVTAISTNRPLGDDDIIETDAVILATGKHLGGGIRADGKKLCEAIFDLPLFLGGSIIRESFMGHITDPDFLAPQRFSRIGLKTDSKGRPVDQKGDPIFPNLFAAGQILGGFDPTIDGSAEGVDLCTGYRCGIEAAGGAA